MLKQAGDTLHPAERISRVRFWGRWSSPRATRPGVHRQRYGTDLDLPAYNFTAADLGAERADRDPAVAWAARALLALILVVVLLGLRGRGFGGAAGRGLLLGAVRPWRVAALPAPTSRVDRVLVWLVPPVVLVASRLVFTWFAALAHRAGTGSPSGPRRPCARST